MMEPPLCEVDIFTMHEAAPASNSSASIVGRLMSICEICLVIQRIYSLRSPWMKSI